MARPVLAEYLLKLATDPTEFVRFRESRAEAKRRMQEAGLTEDQIEIVLSKDPDRVKAAIVAESGEALQNICIGQTRTFSSIDQFDDE
jgi:hypothetical protein